MAPLRKTRHRGTCRVAGDILLNIIAYNLVRIPNRSRATMKALAAGHGITRQARDNLCRRHGLPGRY